MGPIDIVAFTPKKPRSAHDYRGGDYRSTNGGTRSVAGVESQPAAVIPVDFTKFREATKLAQAARFSRQLQIQSEAPRDSVETEILLQHNLDFALLKLPKLAGENSFGHAVHSKSTSPSTCTDTVAANNLASKHSSTPKKNRKAGFDCNNRDPQDNTLSMAARAAAAGAWGLHNFGFPGGLPNLAGHNLPGTAKELSFSGLKQQAGLQDDRHLYDGRKFEVGKQGLAKMQHLQERNKSRRKVLGVQRVNVQPQAGELRLLQRPVLGCPCPDYESQGSVVRGTESPAD